MHDKFQAFAKSLKEGSTIVDCGYADSKKNHEKKSNEWIRTTNLEIMSLMDYHCPTLLSKISLPGFLKNPNTLNLFAFES